MDNDLLRHRFSSEEINALPLQCYEGEVQIIRSPSQWRKIEPLLRADAILGFDTETRPTFRKGKINAPALIQIATASTVYLAQLGWLPFGEIYTSILEDPGIVKVGAGIRADMAALNKVYPFTVAGVVDLGDLARQCNLPNQGLRNLAASLFGWRISKGSQCSNWSLRQLTPRQIAYAATDAWIGRMIYMRLRDIAEREQTRCAGA